MSTPLRPSQERRAPVPHSIGSSLAPRPPHVGSRLSSRLLQRPEIALTAVYLKMRDGYVGFIEELPGVNSHGRTIDEARVMLRELARIVFDEERRGAEEHLASKDCVREPFVMELVHRASA